MIDWKKQHCGVYQAPSYAVLTLMPDLAEVIATFPHDEREFTWDVKVHMLMPGQYPCIPGWHVDMVPRGADGKQDFSRTQLDQQMYLWVSSPPITEFRDGREIRPQEWVAFTQQDEHRGRAATEHGWRCFIRAVPAMILQPAPSDRWLRRHSQVYLDAETFKW